MFSQGHISEDSLSILYSAISDTSDQVSITICNMVPSIVTLHMMGLRRCAFLPLGWNCLVLFNIVCPRDLLLGSADCCFTALLASFSACCIKESVDRNVVEFTTFVAKLDGHLSKCIFE